MNSRLSRGVALLAVAAVSAGTLSACSPGTSSGGGSITVFTPYPEAYSIPLESLAEAYEAENEGVEVEIQTMPLDGYAEALQTQFTGGTAPDVLMLEPPAITDFSSRGFLLDMSEDFTQDGWAESFGPTNLASLRGSDGKDYAAPWTTINIKQMYRADIFDDLGIEVPTNWTEQIETNEQLLAADIEPFWFSIKGDDASIWWRFTLMLNAGFRTVTDEINLRHSDGWSYDSSDAESISGESYTADEKYVAFRNGITDPAESEIYQEALDLLLQMQGSTGDGMNLNPEEASQRFLAGELGQRMAQDADIPSLIKTAEEAGITDFSEDSMGIIQFPPLTEEDWPALTEGPSNPLIAVRNALSVNAASDNTETAIDFVKFATSLEGQEITFENGFIEEGTYMLQQPSAVEGVSYPEGVGLQTESVETVPELSLFGFGMPPTYDAQDMDEYNTQFQKLWLGDITVDEFLTQRSASNLAALERNLEVYAAEIDQSFIDEHVN